MLNRVHCAHSCGRPLAEPKKDLHTFAGIPEERLAAARKIAPTFAFISASIAKLDRLLRASILCELMFRIYKLESEVWLDEALISNL